VSYAQKLREKFPARHETLVKIEGQDEAGAKRTLSGLNIHEIGGPLAQVVSRKDGSLLLVSQGEEQKKRLEETLWKEQGVKVTQVEKLNPTITLTELGREWKLEEVVMDIWEKNEWIRMERTKEQFTAEVRVLSKRVCKDPNKQNVVLTMDAKTQEECLKRKKAVVGLTFFWMEEKFEVNRCFNCHGYGHQKKDLLQVRGSTHQEGLQGREEELPELRQRGTEGSEPPSHRQMVPGVPTEAGNQSRQDSTQLSREEENRDVRDPRGTRDKLVVLQANLGRGREATDLLQRTAEENEADVVLIQEGYCYIPTWVGWTKYGGGRTDKIATLVRTGRRSIELTQFTGPTISTVVIEGKGGDIALANVYAPQRGR
jgi:hypothetical protein